MPGRIAKRSAQMATLLDVLRASIAGQPFPTTATLCPRLIHIAIPLMLRTWPDDVAMTSTPLVAIVELNASRSQTVE